MYCFWPDWPPFLTTIAASAKGNVMGFQFFFFFFGAVSDLIHLVWAARERPSLAACTSPYWIQDQTRLIFCIAI